MSLSFLPMTASPNFFNLFFLRVSNASWTLHQRWTWQVCGNAYNVNLFECQVELLKTIMPMVICVEFNYSTLNRVSVFRKFPNKIWNVANLRSLSGLKIRMEFEYSRTFRDNMSNAHLTEIIWIFNRSIQIIQINKYRSEKTKRENALRTHREKIHDYFLNSPDLCRNFLWFHFQHLIAMRLVQAVNHL